ncbi:DUF389 domain-containing protein [Christiangramia sp.]|uniref:DUF389 domain-containing protein n=1 Tax=Christiangramia sp. TaxID=1931228 RepID=UPI002615FA5C|nr:DUF389 domain-containing protein [Christiangramia sp.]
MRQLILKIPEGHKSEITEAIEDCKGKVTIQFHSNKKDNFITHFPNDKVNEFIERIDHIEDIEISLNPRGVIPFYPPASETPDQVADVKPKSALEIYLAGIQSVGSLFGLIGYSIAAGIIVWIGLYTTTIYLLVAAMLVAPLAGPAMNSALATASGNMNLLKNSVKRYFLAIAAGIISSFLLSVIFSLKIMTPLMIEISHVSKVAILLPLISGFAGGINICQSERDSLVSGAAVGILVAASLAPPVGLLGCGIYLGNSDVIWSSIFRILLQLVGIHLSATLVFRYYGKVDTKGVRFYGGNKNISIFSNIAAVIIFVGLGIWQFSNPPFLRKASMNTELTEDVQQQLSQLSDFHLIEETVNFTGEKINNLPVVRFSATVIKKDTSMDDNILEARIITYLKDNIKKYDDEFFEVYEIKILKE